MPTAGPALKRRYGSTVRQRQGLASSGGNLQGLFMVPGAFFTRRPLTRPTSRRGEELADRLRIPADGFSGTSSFRRRFLTPDRHPGTRRRSAVPVLMVRSPRWARGADRWALVTGQAWSPSGSSSLLWSLIHISEPTRL